MTDSTQFQSLPDGRRIAYRHNRGKGPALVFLPGYMSDMAGSKATALFDWARVRAALPKARSRAGATRSSD